MATYTLADGTRKTQLTISGDTTVVFPTKLDYFGVRSLDGANILVSKIKAPTVLEDGVYSTDEGDGDVVVDDGVFTDTLYLKGTGTVVVYGGAKPNHLPFKATGKGGGGSGGGCSYKGTTTTAIENGSTTNPITIDGEEYTAVFGDIVVYGYTEFVFDGTAWSEFGRPFDTTPTSGSANAVTSDGIHKVTPWARGTGTYSANGGRSCQSSGDSSIAYGYNSKATNYYTAAFGYGATADMQYMTAVGNYNKTHINDLFVVGNGTSPTNRSNIFEVNRTFANVNGDIQKNGVSLPTPYTTMPTITEAMLGQIAQYVGETANDYVKGYFYIASSDGAAEPTYSWVHLPTQNGYSETVLYTASSPHTNNIELSQAYTNFDDIVVVWKYSSPDPDTIDNYSVRYTKTYKVSTFGDSVVFLCEEATSTDDFTAYMLSDTTHINYHSKAGTLYNWISKVIGIKY